MNKAEHWNSIYQTQWSVFLKSLMLIGVLGGHYFTAISQGQESPAPLLANARAMFDVIPAPTPEELQTPLVQLGRRLFWDERLSVNGQVACASCHLASHWGADAERFSLDAKEKRTKRNSQTVFNAMLQPQLRWTGDRTSGAHQAERSLTGSMGFANSDDVLELLRQHEYEKSFKRAFPFVVDSMSSANYARAIEAYESTLRTPAPFDLYLNGQTDVLSDKQVAGLQFFMELGCADCHSGQLIGGESLNKFGVHHDYWTETGSVNRDVGLFELTTNEEDRYRFRTSMLRNIEKTGPFFHDGSVASLPEAVRVMAKVQLDQELDSGQLEAIVAFLGSLTGEVPANYSQPDAPSELSPEILNDAVQPNAVEFRSLRIRSFRNRASSDSRRPAK